MLCCALSFLKELDVFVLSVLAACSPPSPEEGGLLLIQGRVKM